MLFEDTVGAHWSAYTDRNPAEVKLAKGWVYRAPPRIPKKLRRPNWSLLRGSGEAAQVARGALATELDRRVSDEQPTTWPDLVTLGVGVARAVLGEEPKRDARPCKRRRLAWLRSKEVAWWDNKAQQAQDKADQGDSFGVFAAFKELRLRGSSLSSGEVRPVDAQAERDAWAEHFRKIGEGPGEGGR